VTELKNPADEQATIYDALEASDSAVAVLGKPELLGITRELTEQVRANARATTAGSGHL
jgi:hypothetical protein